MLAIYGALIYAFAGVQSYASLSDALIAKNADISVHTGSSVVDVGLRLMTFAEAFKIYIAGNLKHFDKHVPLLLIVFGSYVVFFNACATLSCFVIQPTEFRRLFGPVSDDDVPPPLLKSRVAVTSGIVTFMVLFIYVPGFAKLEGGVRGNPSLMAAIEAIERNVEKIDDAIYKQGTIEQIGIARAVALGNRNTSKAILVGQVDRAFDQMSNNVDRYLDWYYSLSAEYMRLAKLLKGEIEGYMEAKLSDHLRQGEAVAALSNGIKNILATDKIATSEYQQAVKEILDRNRLVADGTRTKVERFTSLDDIVAMPSHLDVVELNKRAAAGTVAGVGAIVTAKIVTKGMFKAAAKALSKVAFSKAAGTTGGAATGAVLGSVVPVVGTVIGGILGGLVGGVLVDKTLLTLEEALSRDEFKKDILLAIEEARIDFKSKLLSVK